jgi:hypothetical protein
MSARVAFQVSPGQPSDLSQYINAQPTQPISFGRSVVRSVVRSFGRSFGRSVGRSVVRSVVRSFGRSFGRSVGRSLGRSFGRSVVRSFGRLFGRSVGRSVVRSVVRSITFHARDVRWEVEEYEEYDGRGSPQAPRALLRPLLRSPFGTPGVTGRQELGDQGALMWSPWPRKVHRAKPSFPMRILIPPIFTLGPFWELAWRGAMIWARWSRKWIMFMLEYQGTRMHRAISKWCRLVSNISLFTRATKEPESTEQIQNGVDGYPIYHFPRARRTLGGRGV